MRGHDARAGKPSAIDGITQGNVAVHAGVANIADRGDSGLEIFACEFRAMQRALRGAFGGDDAQHLHVLQTQVCTVHLAQ